MAQHPIINQGDEMLPLQIATKALATARSMQTRKSASAFYTDIDGNGIITGALSQNGINKYDPLTGEQAPLWEGISQEQLDEESAKILNDAKTEITNQITVVNNDINNANKLIDDNRAGLEQEAYLRSEGDKHVQEAVNTVTETASKLTTDYEGMATDVNTVKQNMTNVLTRTDKLENDMIVSTSIEYAAGDATTAPTSGWSTSTPTLTGNQRAWMRTKVTYGNGTQSTSSPVLVTGANGTAGATGAAGVSVTNITPFWQTAATQPTKPTQKAPGGGWTTTEPNYTPGKKLWTCNRIDYSNDQWSWTSVQQSSAYEAAALALATADGKNRRFMQPDTPTATNLTQGDEWWQTSSKPLETYWTGEPNNSVSVLVDHSDEVERIWVWNGTSWATQRLAATDIIVTGSIAAGLVSADFFDGAKIVGGVFKTRNGRLLMNDTGLVLTDKSGHATVTMLAETGEATFNDVHIVDGALSAPVIESGSINGADYRINDADGKQIGRINSNGITFGSALTYALKNGVWTLTLKGAVQAGGDISGATITGAILQTTSDANRGIKLTSTGMIAYDTTGKTKFVLKTDGSIMMDGSAISNGEFSAAKLTGGEITGATLQTLAEANRGVKIKGKVLSVYDDSGNLMLALDGADGTALLTGGVRTSYTGSRVELRNDTYTVPTGGTAIQGSITGYDDVGEVWHLTGSSNRGAAVGSPQLSLHMGVSPQQPELMIQRYSDGTQLSIVAGRVDIASTVATVGGKQSGIYVNGMRLDPVVVPASDFITFANGYGEYGGGHNISRCYCLQIGKLLLFQLEVSGSIPSSSSYTRVGTLKNGYIPLRAVNVPAVYSGGGMGGAFIIGQTADGNLAPGGVYFGQTTGSKRHWGAATFLAYR